MMGSASGQLLPRPDLCGERVGVRGCLHAFRLADSPPHPKPAASTSPRKRGEVTHLEHRQALRFPTTRERFVECCDLILIEHKIAGRGVFGRVFHS